MEFLFPVMAPVWPRVCMRVSMATNGCRTSASDCAGVRRRSDRQQGAFPRDRRRAGLRVRRPGPAHARGGSLARLRPLHVLPLTAAPATAARAATDSRACDRCTCGH